MEPSITPRQRAALDAGRVRVSGPGPGRPRKQAWIDALYAIASEPKNRKALLMRLLAKKPDVAMAYLAGKPAETVLVGGADAPPIRVSVVEAAAAIARRNRGLEGPQSAGVSQV